MKKCFLLVAVVLSISLAPNSQAVVQTPAPPYPMEALQAKVTGAGICQVTFNSRGHVDKAAMSKSTGSKLLDESTIKYARKNWIGEPNTTTSIPIEYQLAPEMAKVRAKVRITGSQPPYPLQALAARIQGSGVIKVSFDETGKVVSATMSQSTGSDLLDQNAIKYVTESWHIAVGRKSTMFVPITYRIR